MSIIKRDIIGGKGWPAVAVALGQRWGTREVRGALVGDDPHKWPGCDIYGQDKSAGEMHYDGC